MASQEAMMALSFPDPPMLDGTEVYGIYEQWQMKMCTKLYHTEDYYTKEHTVDYLASRLSGLAFDVVRPRLKFDMGAGQAWGSTDEMWQELEKLFKLSKTVRLHILNDKFGGDERLNFHQQVCE